MTKNTSKTVLISAILAVYAIATMTACSSSTNNDDLSSDIVTTTTTVTEVQTPAPETTTIPEKADETTVVTEPQNPETTTTAQTKTPVSETTTTVQTTTPVPETTTTVQTTTPTPETTTTSIQTTTSKPQTEAPAVEKLNKKMYAMGAVCSYEKNTIKFSDPVDKYHMNDEVFVVEKVAGMYNGKGCDEGYFYKLDDGTYVPAGLFTDNKNWQAETTFQTYDWNPEDPGLPVLPPSDQFIGDLFD